MQVHRDIDQLPPFRNAVVTIGTFDGVHMGHRQIIEKLKVEAKSKEGETGKCDACRWCRYKKHTGIFVLERNR